MKMSEGSEELEVVLRRDKDMAVIHNKHEEMCSPKSI